MHVAVGVAVHGVEDGVLHVVLSVVVRVGLNVAVFVVACAL